jgi:hypothetical protein
MVSSGRDLGTWALGPEPVGPLCRNDDAVINIALGALRRVAYPPDLVQGLEYSYIHFTIPCRSKSPFLLRDSDIGV